MLQANGAVSNATPARHLVIVTVVMTMLFSCLAYVIHISGLRFVQPYQDAGSGRGAPVWPGLYEDQGHAIPPREGASILLLYLILQTDTYDSALSRFNTPLQSVFCLSRMYAASYDLLQLLSHQGSMCARMPVLLIVVLSLLLTRATTNIGHSEQSEHGFTLNPI